LQILLGTVLETTGDSIGECILGCTGDFCRFYWVLYSRLLETLLVNVYLDVLETFADFTGYCTRDYWRLYVRFPGDNWRLSWGEHIVTLLEKRRVYCKVKCLL